MCWVLGGPAALETFRSAVEDLVGWVWGCGCGCCGQTSERSPEAGDGEEWHCVRRVGGGVGDYVFRFGEVNIMNWLHTKLGRVKVRV